MEEIFFTVLASSSSGNCAFLRANGMNVLIDAGITCAQIRKRISPYGVDISDIDAIFITHDHGDHCCALETISKKYCPAVFASEISYDYIVDKFPPTKKLNWKRFESGSSFQFNSLKVSTCRLPHDAGETVAYQIDTGKKRISWITDLGMPTASAIRFAQESNVLVLESNYCPKMLANSHRPPRTINRIAGSHGHLSNADAISVLKQLDLNVVERVFLAHISRECNSIEHIKELLSPLPPPLLHKIEIVNPFKMAENPYTFRQ